MFNYNHLYYFYMTAKLGGVMNASRALRLAQPALSVQLKTLEANLKRKLFRKSGRRLVLTPEGQRAYGFCRRVFEAAEEFAGYLEHSDASTQKRARIGVTPEIERPFVTEALTSLLKRRPGEEAIPVLSMVAGEHTSLVEKLRTRELDVLVTNQQAHHPEVALLAELAMPVIAVVTPELAKLHRLSRKTSLSAMLKDSSIGLLLPGERHRLRVETDLYLQRAKIRNRTVFESDILGAITRAALDGVGIAWLPTPYVATEIKLGSLVPVGSASTHWKHRVFVHCETSVQDEPVVKDLRAHFEQVAKDMSGR
jgi:LysR family transcriptional regulator, transcriptional activator of nhaA